MNNLQDESAETANLARRISSRSIRRRVAEWPPRRIVAITGELKFALAREAALLREKDAILRRQVILTQEFEHRLINSLQLIVSLLSLQSRKTESREVAEQLMIAAKRVGAFGRVHRQLHLLDLLDTVELKQYLAQALRGHLRNAVRRRSLSPDRGRARRNRDRDGRPASAA